MLQQQQQTTTADENLSNGSNSNSNNDDDSPRTNTVESSSSFSASSISTAVVNACVSLINSTSSEKASSSSSASSSTSSSSLSLSSSSSSSSDEDEVDDDDDDEDDDDDDDDELEGNDEHADQATLMGHGGSIDEASLIYQTRSSDVPLHGMVKRGSASRLAEAVFRSPSNFNLADVTKGGRIGTGRFGCVFKGIWQDAPVALKMISDEDDIDRVGGVLAFEDEAALLFTLRHPNIVDMYGIWTERQAAEACSSINSSSSSNYNYNTNYYNNNKRYMVMEYVPDGDLKTLLAQQGSRGVPTLSCINKLELLQEAASGMSYLGALETPIIHRDLAARNLLICKSDRDKRFHVKVADFGLARVGSTYSCKHSDAPLPWKWMAPEAMLGTYTSASDVWSFGIVMWEVFTNGALPPPLSIKELRNGRRLPQPENCHKSIYQLMMDCWEYDPEKRPSFREIRDRLELIKQDLIENPHLYSSKRMSSPARCRSVVDAKLTLPIVSSAPPMDTSNTPL
jgi:serine/threonine protein kinase